jgi:hypothetical protein
MPEERRLPILHVVQIGDPDFERYAIEDENELIWTGERFDSAGGALFARHHEVAIAAQDILKKSFVEVEPQGFVVPVLVEDLNHTGRVPMAEVDQLLSNASRLSLDTAEHSNGPGDALVLTRIEWGRIKKIKEFLNQP